MSNERQNLLLPDTSSSPSSPSPSSSASRSRRNSKMFWTLGCLYGAAAVGFGAFGAHGLKKKIADPARIANWGTAAHYQLIHSAALLVSAAAAPENRLAAGLFTAGMTLFSGSIYLLVLSPQQFKPLGPVTPIGGLCLIGGWLALGLRTR